MSESIVIPITAKLSIGLITYEVQGFRVSMQVGGISVCQVAIGVGRNTGNPTSVTRVVCERGDRAILTVSNLRATSSADSTAYNANGYRLFDGRVDDFGPAGMSFGRNAFVFRLVGRLSDLMSGTMAVNGLNQSGWRSTDNLFKPFSTSDIDTVEVLQEDRDFWWGLRSALRRILQQDDVPLPELQDASGPGVLPPQKDSVRGFIQNVFGSRINTQALESLQAIEGFLTFRTAMLEPPGVKTEDVQDLGCSLFESLCRNLGTYLNETFSFEPMLQKILQLANLLRFQLIETGIDVRVVPWVPFFRARDAVRIRSFTYDQLTWQGSTFSPCQGTVLLDDTESIDTSLVVGSYADPDVISKGLGHVHVGPAPQVFTGHSWSIFNGGLPPGAGDGPDFARSVMSVQYSNDPSFPMNRLAKLITWETNFSGQTVSVSCPFFRSDIGLLTAVQVDAPPIPELQITSDTLAIYGSVTGIDMEVDVVEGRASTKYTIGYARGYSQQRTISQQLAAREHPFFDRNYVRGRLDTPFGSGHWGDAV